MAPTTTALTTFKGTLRTQPKDHNSNDNTSTPRKASVGTNTSPGVIQLQATSPTVEAENIRPPPPGVSAGLASSLSQDKDKDARAYEHDRQRTKHAGEWAKRRARKGTSQGKTGRPGVGRQAVAGATHAGRRAKSFRGGKVGLDVDVDVYAVLPQKKDVERNEAKIWDELGSGILKKASLPPGEGNGTDASKAVSVNLSELVALSQRKPRKQKVDDFEVIPPIRSVIALDDVANIHDMDLDETWEHVYANDGVTQTGPSYACVVGKGCQ